MNTQGSDDSSTIELSPPPHLRKGSRQETEFDENRALKREIDQQINENSVLKKEVATLQFDMDTLMSQNQGLRKDIEDRDEVSTAVRKTLDFQIEKNAKMELEIDQLRSKVDAKARKSDVISDNTFLNGNGVDEHSPSQVSNGNIMPRIYI